MSKVCVFLAEGFEMIEALTTVDILRRAGIETDMVSITDRHEVTSSHGVRIYADKLFDEIDFGITDMIVLPGGMPGTKNLEDFEPLMAQVETFHKERRYISAICAAPGILGQKGMLRGRKACSFPEMEERLLGAEVTKNQVETDGHIITARGMGCSIPFGLAIVERFQGRKAAEAIAEKIVYC